MYSRQNCIESKTAFCVLCQLVYLLFFSVGLTLDRPSTGILHAGVGPIVHDSVLFKSFKVFCYSLSEDACKWGYMANVSIYVLAKRKLAN